jgi:hypothetical protein
LSFKGGVTLGSNISAKVSTVLDVLDPDADAKIFRMSLSDVELSLGDIMDLLGFENDDISAILRDSGVTGGSMGMGVAVGKDQTTLIADFGGSPRIPSKNEDPFGKAVIEILEDSGLGCLKLDVGVYFVKPSSGQPNAEVTLEIALAPIRIDDNFALRTIDSAGPSLFVTLEKDGITYAATIGLSTTIEICTENCGPQPISPEGDGDTCGYLFRPPLSEHIYLTGEISATIQTTPQLWW